MQEKPDDRAATAPLLPPTLLPAIAAVVALTVAGPRVRGLLFASAGVAAPAALAALLLASPAALAIAKTRAASRWVALVALLALGLAPLHVQTAAWLAVVGERGWLDATGWGSLVTVGGLAGAVLLHALAAVPAATLLLVVALRRVDPRHERQAWLDTPWWSVIARITTTAAAPAIAAAAVVLALGIAAEIAVTDLLRIRTFAEEVYTQAATGELLAADTGSGGLRRLFAGVLAIGLVGTIALQALVRSATQAARRAVDAPTESAWSIPTRRGGVADWVLLATVALVGVVPIAALAWQAGVVVQASDEGVQRAWSVAKLASEVALAPWRHGRELTVSLTLASVVATLSTALGFALAWRLRSAGVWGVTLACTLLGVAIATPGPVVAVMVIRVLNQPPDAWLAPLGELYGTWFAPALAQTLRIAPVATLLLWPVAVATPDALLAAARADGAGPIRRMLLVAAPMAIGSLIATWLVSLALSFGELSATALVAPPGTPPISVRMLSLLHYGVEDRVAALCLSLLVVQFAVGWLVLRGMHTARAPR